MGSNKLGGIYYVTSVFMSRCKMKDSIVVQVERKVQHKLYGKIIKRRSKIHAHDAGNTCHIGDIVNIKECRPISKTKTWTLTEIKTRAAE